MEKRKIADNGAKKVTSGEMIAVPGQQRPTCAINSHMEELPELLLLLYEGVSSPERMQAFLAGLVGAVGAKCALFREHSLSTAGSVHVDTSDLAEQAGYSEESLKAYQERYWEVDLYLQRAMERFRTADCGVSRLLVTQAELDRSELYADYARPFDLGPMMWGTLAQRPDYHASISIVRPIGADHFDAPELELLTALTPHLRQALKLSRTLRSLEQTNAMLKQGIEDAGIAIAMAGQDGAILRATPGAEQLFATPASGVSLRGGRLALGNPGQQRALEALIAAACLTGAGRGADQAMGTPLPVRSRAAGGVTVRSWTPSAGGAMLVTRKPPQRPLQVVVSPFCPGSLLNEPQATALIQFSDPFAVPKSRGAILQALYQLTAAESRLADALLQGLEVRDAAEALGITFETARFHLKRVFAKTGVGRQTELIRLMLSLPGA
jgi:DNA-binding CsgD family transcriptional regulator